MFPTLGPKMILEAWATAAEKILSLANGVWSLVRKREQRDRFAASSTDQRVIVGRAATEMLRPADAEVIPIMFEVRLGDRIPKLEVGLQAINYLTKPLQVREVQVDCQIGSCPIFEKLHLAVEVTIPARRSRQAICRRPLVESEISMLKSTFGMSGPLDAALRWTLSGQSGGKDIRAHANGWQAFRGWIEGLPSKRG